MKNTFKGWTDQQVEMVKNNIIPEGKNRNQCSYFCRTYLHQGFRPVRSKQSCSPRGRDFAVMHESGMSYAEIARKVGLSRQRVAVLVTTWLKRTNRN